VSDAPRVGAVVLAAGASTRLGHPKQLLAHDGVPLVRRAAEAARDAGARPVLVVLGAGAAAIQPALDALPGVQVHVHADWADGLASSLGAGLRALDDATGDDPCDGVLVTLADQPLVDAIALRRLLDAFGAGARVVAARYADALGAPAVFGREHLPALRALAGDHGAGRWLRAHRDLVTAVPMAAAALDVDTPADVVRLRDAAS
jgi:CTP:molybdopterin cytidylyltransferase MocA